MESYKIGNKVTGIIRAYSSGKIGSIEAQYDNEPYTIVRGVSATLNFTGQNTPITSARKETNLTYNSDRLNEVVINNVTFNDKICALIFAEQEEGLCSKAENFDSDENGTIYLNHQDNIYQVFVYDDEGHLETAYGTYTEKTMTLSKPNASYLVVYSYLGEKAYNFNKPSNLYVTLDLEIQGNVDDQTTDMFIHIEKCGFKINKNMYFSQTANAVDITFTVIESGNDYIVVK